MLRRLADRGTIAKTEAKYTRGNEGIDGGDGKRIARSETSKKVQTPNQKSKLWV